MSVLLNLINQKTGCLMNSSVPDSMDKTVFRYVQSLCEALEVDFRLYTTKLHRAAVERDQEAKYHQRCLDSIREGTYDYGYTFSIDEGRKYLKVVMNSDANRSVHCFVDKNTGEVYMSASWKAPAKGVRYNLMDDNSRDQCYHNCDWAGSYLYAK